MTDSCDAVRTAFVGARIGPAHMVPRVPSAGAGLKHCPSARTCCREPMVHRYQNSIVKDYHSVVAGVTAPLNALLHNSRNDFELHFENLLKISLNKTNNLFQVMILRRRR